MDVQVRYTFAVTRRQAYDSFVASVLTSQNVGTILRVKNNVTPLLEEVEEIEEMDEDLQTAIIVVVVVSAFLLVISILVYIFFRRRGDGPRTAAKLEQVQEAEVAGFDNASVSLDDLADRSSVP